LSLDSASVELELEVATMFSHISLLKTSKSILAVACAGVLHASLSLAQGQTPTPQDEAASPNHAANAAASTDTTTGQPAAQVAEQSYVGTSQCFVCHRAQANTYSETNHAHAFAHLAEKYRTDAACLKCHVTGFAEANGYVAETDKDLLMVGCESCHGPGARHIDAAQRFVLADPAEEAKIEQEMRDTITKSPTDKVCTTCHATQAHGHHPPYDDTLPAPHSAASSTVTVASVAGRSLSGTRTFRYVPGYSVKTCGSCHYDHYKKWRIEAHSALAARLPTKYTNDLECQKCHVNADALVAMSAARTGGHDNYIGLACESCHGPALEHVRFNVRYIHGPPLGPKLEQAARDSIRARKPAATCIQCHTREGHHQHPSFDDGSSHAKS
jgi:hypothetical protein